jgi:alcohol dehydrogenase (cytochrome c)
MPRIGSLSAFTTLLALAATLLAGPIAAPAQDEPGRSSFLKMCSGCHGANARGGRGPDLTSGQWRWGGTDSDIVRNILEGIPGTQMPPFPVGESEARSIVTFLRSLRGPAGEEPQGDPGRGRALFARHCSACHMFHGAGGKLGPDLSEIREEKRPAELRAAIVKPDATRRPGFESVEWKQRGAPAARGALKNEDTFSVQVMDEKERLHLFLKKDLEYVRSDRRSLMPALGLGAQEVDAIVTFLRRTGPAAELPPWQPAADFNVTFARLKQASSEPHNWLTYWGDYRGTHSSALSSIKPSNVGTLRGAWAYQLGGSRNETSPIVVDGLMFVTGPLNDATALDARTGRVVWRYRRRVPDDVHSSCTVMTNRGLAVLGDRLYMGTLDTHLVALDAKTGGKIWDVPVDDYRQGYSITHAPLAINGKIIVGVTAGECGLNGFVDAYDATTGKKQWRFWAVPRKDDPEHAAARATWSGNSADTGGAPTWMTGTYDVETDTLFWTTGNPSPDYDGSVRQGDNLYACSVLALEPNTGRLKWYFQFTPHDTHDWDANETPVLIDAKFGGRARKLMIQANRNGFYYVLDRLTGEFLTGKPFVKQTWARGLDAKGRPIVIPGTDPTPEGNYACPDASGGANWSAPSFDRTTGSFFVSVRESCGIYTSKTKIPVPGLPYTGSGQQEDPGAPSRGAIRAFDALTGNLRWDFPLHDGNVAAGVLSTAGGVVFACTRDGYLLALDARSGKELWHYQTGGLIRNSPISYSVDGRQYIAVTGDTTLFVFALPTQGIAEKR